MSLVLAYNRKVRLALCCPLTSKVIGYPFEVVLPPGGQAQGAILSDQIKSLDWRARELVSSTRYPIPCWRKSWPESSPWLAGETNADPRICNRSTV